MKMNPFKKKAKEVVPPHPLRLKLQMQLEARLRQLAAFLQAKTTQWTTRKKKTVLILFCFAFAAASGWVAYDNLEKKPLATLRITPLHFVPLANDDEPTQHLPSKELRRVYCFKKYLDSLSTNVKGQAVRDSLLRGRPHLMDTLNYLENIYNNEQKNEAYGKEEPEN